MTTSPSQSLSTSLGAIPKATSHIVTRSKSLRLSGESSSSSSNSPKQLNLSPPSPTNRKNSYYSPAALEVAKASSSLIDKFDSSLLNLDVKTEDKKRNSGHLELEDDTFDVSLCRSNIYGSSVDADDENSSTQTSKPQSPWPWLQRDIALGSRGKRSRFLRPKSSSNIKNNASRIVYSPGVFNGRERLDIVRRLSDMDATHILDGIWCRLSAEDLGRALQVNK